MRKYFLSLVALATILLSAACSKVENPYISENGEMVTFNIADPEMGTRAYSDGLTANKLTVAVYNQAGEHLAALRQDVSINGSTTVQLPLVTGVTYDIVFWAYAEGAPYTFNAENHTVTLNDTDKYANNEKRDAFFYGWNDYTVSGPKTELVELTRPFAQLNVATLDYTTAVNAGVEITTTNIKVEGVYNSFDLLNGNVLGTAQIITLDQAATPKAASQKLKGYETYDWLSMNYLLVNEKTTVTATMNTNNTNVTRQWFSIPLQRNYRTNILGNILTTTTDFNVVIDDKFTDDHLETDLAKLQFAAVNGGEVILTDDVVLTEPLVIKSPTKASVPTFEVIIDLNGHTISQQAECTGSYSMIVNHERLIINATNGGSITFQDNGNGGGDVYGTYIVNNYGELIINDGTLEHKGTINHLDDFNTNLPIQNYQGKVTINGGTIKSADFRSLRDFTAGGEIIINGGNFIGQVWMQGLGTGPSSLTINGGQFTPIANDVSSIFITNGSNVVNLSVSDGNFATKIGCTDPSKEGVKGSVKGGTFGDATNLESGKLLAEGKHVVESDGKYIVVDQNLTVAANADELRSALKNLNNIEIKLMPGIYEGLFEVPAKKVLTISANNDVTIDGKITAIDNSRVTLKGLTLANSNGVTSPYGHLDNETKTSILATYNAGFEVINCTLNITSEYGGIRNQEGNNAFLIVKNSTFNCNGQRPIIYKANVDIDGCTFNDQYKYALQLYGFADQSLTYVANVKFTNNKIVEPCETSGKEPQAISISGSYQFIGGNLHIEKNTVGSCVYCYDNKTNVLNYLDTWTVSGDVNKSDFVVRD